MREPKLIQKCLILRASQALGCHYFSVGFHPFPYTVLYTRKTQFKGDKFEPFGSATMVENDRQLLRRLTGIRVPVFPMLGDGAGGFVEPLAIF